MKDLKNTVAFILARGGSKRLPNKNIHDFCGKPLIAWTIEAALNAQSVSRVFISTDSEDIAKVARDFGAEVPFLRPGELAGDDVGSSDVVVHMRNWCISSGLNFKNLILLQPTSPLRRAGDIDAAIRQFESKSRSADEILMSVCSLGGRSTWLYEHTPDGWIRPICENRNFSELLMPNGSIYISSFADFKSFESKRTEAYLMSTVDSVDIDTQDDFDLAEFYMKRRLGKKSL